MRAPDTSKACLRKAQSLAKISKKYKDAASLAKAEAIQAKCSAYIRKHKGFKTMVNKILRSASQPEQAPPAPKRPQPQ